MLVLSYYHVLPLPCQIIPLSVLFWIYYKLAYCKINFPNNFLTKEPSVKIIVLYLLLRKGKRFMTGIYMCLCIIFTCYSKIFKCSIILLGNYDL